MRRTAIQMQAYENGLRDLAAPPPSETANAGKRIGASKDQNRRYGALDEDGICRVAEKLEDDFVIGNRISPVNTKDLVVSDADVKFRPTPVCYNNLVSAYVDRVILTMDQTGTTVYKVVTRQTRRPEIGDKFASRHGQK